MNRTVIGVNRRVAICVCALSLALLGSPGPVAQPAQGREPSPARVEPNPELTAALSAVPPAGSGEAMNAGDFALLALIASGADRTATRSLASALGALGKEFASSLPEDADSRTRGDLALRFLYDRVLSRYSEFQTRVDVALDKGTYNCVSSAVLYYYFARVAGLQCEGVETPVHAFCTVAVNGKKIDVETTNPYGFDPGTKRELAGTNPNETRYAVVPRSNYLNRKPIDERRLLALIYVNRAASLEKEGKFAEAAGIALDSWTLQATEAARADLAERCINYAASLSRAGTAAGSDAALDYIDECARRWGEYPRYREFAAATVGTALNRLMDRGDYEGAFALLDARASLLDRATARSMRQLSVSNYLSAFATKHSPEETLNETERFGDILADADRAKVIAFAYGRASEELARQGKWLEAAAVLDSGLAVLPDRAELVRARTAYRHNFAVEAHNRAAAAFNAGDGPGAKAIVQEALRSVPESTLLKGDLSRF